MGRMPTATIAEPADAPAPAMTSLPAAARGGAGAAGPGVADPRDLPGDRPALPRPPSLPGAAAIAAARRRRHPRGVRPARLDPVRPDRRRRPQPRSRPAVARRRATAASRPTRCSTRRGRCTRPTTRASRSSRPPSCRGTGSPGTGCGDSTRAARSTSTPPLVEELLARIRDGGPMSSTDVEPRAAIDWYWRPTNQVRAILEALGEAGILGLARRDGQPPRLRPRRAALPRRAPRAAGSRSGTSSGTSCCRATGRTGCSGRPGAPSSGWARCRGPRPATRTGSRRSPPAVACWSPSCVDRGDLVPVAVEGVRGLRYVPATEIARLERRGARGPAGRRRSPRPGVAFLAALDPLVWDRDLLRSLYDFDYLWEVYVPAAKRRWGYYVLPILFGDRLVGRIEPRIERKSGHAPDRRAVVGGRLRSRSRSPGSSRRSARPGRPSGVRRGAPAGLAADEPPPGAREAGSGAPERRGPRGTLAEVDDARHPGAAIALLVDGRDPELRRGARR